ncbi:hypothetical protein Dvina_43105 [Dactylosporangium vinaceum]|uniref:Adhesin domain-containing protein n=1 Tax=Dactylosporangium vinaceum TaxID=53362 RepID=A0ABV5MHA1_9ACTN|nr:hypothetical protein [Dactylosporangium vinaceum]UAB94820.1 hypothetical protein Dvina_43105 [Dactylosporangium vinaceum]
MKSLPIRVLTPATAALLLALGACGSPSAAPDKPAKDGPGQTATNSFEVKDDVSVVEVDSEGGTITVKAGAGATIKVTETAAFKSDKPGRKQKLEGGELILGSGGCPKNDCSISYVVEMPSTLTARLDSSGGRIELTGLTGLIDVQSDGGAVTGDALAPPEFQARTGGGPVDVKVTQAPDRIDIDSGGGNVNLRLTKDGYALTADLDGGNQSGTIKQDAGSSHKVKIATGGGSLAFV